jgi:hypothetical protein
MKKVFQIFVFCSKEVCIPSSDYYAHGNDWYKDDVQYLCPVGGEYNTEEEAIQSLQEIENMKDEYTILPIFKKA